MANNNINSNQNSGRVVEDSVLRIDNIISTQPNIGPNIPDGGYGWVIVMSVSFFKAVIPSIITAYGTFLLFNRIEIAPPMDPLLWDVKLMYVPLIYMIVTTFADPFSRKLIIGNKWPVYVGYAGTCLTCAGIILLWFAIKNVSKIATIYIFSGFFTGIGTSILRCLCDIIIIQYFKLKLKSIQIVLQVIKYFGFIFTPIILGNYMVYNGIQHTLLWYGIIILQGLIVCLFIRKPEYLKNLPTNYKLIKEIGGDEEDIFSKTSAELRTRSLSIIKNNQTANDQQSSTSNSGSNVDNTTGNRNHTSSNAIVTSGNRNQTSVNVNDINDNVDVTAMVHKNWEKFDETIDTRPTTSSNVQSNTHVSYPDDDINNDLNNKDEFEDNFTNIPKPIYDIPINDNNIINYSSIDNVQSTYDIQSNIMLTLPSSDEETSKLNKLKSVLKEPTIYKSLIHMINMKYSIFVYFILFPSYLYNKINYIKNYHATFIVGVISVSGLLLVTFNIWVSNDTNKRAIFLAALSWIGSLGYIIISNVKTEYLFIMGAIFVCFSIYAMEYHGEPLLKIRFTGETTITHGVICTITSLSLILFTTVDFEYDTCFKIMSFLQFVNGSMWFSNFIHKRIVSLRRT